MADDRIEVEIVLDDGSIQKGFANIRKQAKKTSKKTGDDFDVFVNKRFGKGIFQLQSQILAIGAAIGAAFAAAFAAGQVIEAANRQEEAVNNLNTALKLAGEFSDEASLGIQQFASDLQEVTTIGDEATLELFSLARTFVKTNEEATKLTQASIELAAATGMSLDSAVKNLGKTFAGLTGELGESLPALRNLSTEALKSGEALDFVLERFGGAAKAQTETFAGSVAQLKNNFGDLLEGIGDWITKSPLAISLIKSLSEIVKKLATDVKESNIEDFGSSLEKASLASRKANEEVKRLREVVADLRETDAKGNKKEGFFFNPEALRVAIDRLAIAERELIKLDKTVERLTKKGAGRKDEVLPVPDINKFRAKLAELELARIQSEEASIKRGGVTAEERTRLIQLGSEKQRALIMQTNEQIRQIEEQFARDASLTQEQRSQLILEKQQELGFKLKEIAVTQSELAKGDVEDFTDAIAQSFQKVTTTMNTFMSTFRNTAINGMVSAFSQLGSALAKGENGFDAFAKAVLGTFGELAIQIGTMMVLVGSGLSVIPGFQSSAASVPFGIALIVLGGALKAIAGGSGAGGASTGSTTAGDFGGGDQEFDGGFDPEEISEQQAINVNIEGNVFDSDETGVRIAEIINESFDTQGTLINAAATS